jgi:hypothetical protein
MEEVVPIGLINMPLGLKIFIWVSLLNLNFWLGFASWSLGKVIIFDGASTEKTPIYLKVLTKGRLFAQGGKLVDVYVKDKKVKQILTGGDGYGYLKYTPLQPGLTRIEARSDGYSDSGAILVVTKSDRVILIELQSGIKESQFSESARANSRKTIEKLSQKYKIIYLDTFFGSGVSRDWLQDEDFVESATLKWQGAGMLKSMKEKGINLFAIIGSAELVSQSTKYIEHRYSFEETRDGETIKNWKEILELLQETSPQEPPTATEKQK